MGFSRQEYWSGLPCPLPGDLPDPGIKPMSLMSAALVGVFFTTSPTWEAILEPWAPNIPRYAFKISFLGTFDSTVPPGNPRFGINLPTNTIDFYHNLKK